ncbi:hypothetical protein DFH29DRAFT_815060 [Suillus ampliporus]|nr:hypothetical protein DFH29DRAFT_815060 [Suillus ampliporus]
MKDIKEENTWRGHQLLPRCCRDIRYGPYILSLFNTNENSVYRKTNLYYLFSCKQDWEIASWLLRSGLSMGKIDTFLSLKMVRNQPLYSDLIE